MWLREIYKNTLRIVAGNRDDIDPALDPQASRTRPCATELKVEATSDPKTRVFYLTLDHNSSTMSKFGQWSQNKQSRCFSANNLSNGTNFTHFQFAGNAMTQKLTMLSERNLHLISVWQETARVVNTAPSMSTGPSGSQYFGPSSPIVSVTKR